MFVWGGEDVLTGGAGQGRRLRRDVNRPRVLVVVAGRLNPLRQPRRRYHFRDFGERIVRAAVQQLGDADHDRSRHQPVFQLFQQRPVEPAAQAFDSLFGVALGAPT
ncbi:MAG: hypothetical protein E6K70_22475 [Planctomycetota bacterium]|nr:MAG: hypothetical protein E6K70_22475 [Planctomycetota bacterium]